LGDNQAAQAIFRARSQQADATHRRLGREGAKTKKHNKDYAEQPLHSITSLATNEQQWRHGEKRFPHTKSV
jgi:hypothetical protein